MDKGIDSDAFELLEELELNTPEAIRAARSSERVAIRVPLIVQPGNSSEIRSLKVKGVTGDISSGGCQVLLPTPLGVGDVFRLSFDQKILRVPVVFARCLRCRLIREDAFESGFAFFTEIDLASAIRNVAA
jgi:hypothetical protein